LNYLITSFLA